MEKVLRLPRPKIPLLNFFAKARDLRQSLNQNIIKILYHNIFILMSFSTLCENRSNICGNKTGSLPQFVETGINIVVLLSDFHPNACGQR